MFKKAHFSKTDSKDKIVKEFKKEGFEPKLITDKPNFVYEKHQHKETKLITCLEGSMVVVVQGIKYNFEPGDKLLIPSNTPHSGIVGSKGCIYFWSEKLM